jgi:ADP-heptose:LPS heptosyltransferase
MPSPTSSNSTEGISPLNLWVRHRSVVYFSGRGIMFGADAELFPRKATLPSKFTIYADVMPHALCAVCEDNLHVCADGEFDYVFVGKRLTALSTRTTEDFLREAVRKLKTGGHMILFQEISKMSPDQTQSLMATLGAWILKDTYTKDGFLLQIYKKLSGSKGVTRRKPSTKPRACIVRYGALGDMIMVSPLIRKLHEDGYEVTLNISPYCSSILQNNPYVDNLLIQERDAIPNHTLGAYWKEWEKDYDRYINLSESIEGKLLKVEGRREFFTHQAWRHEKFNINYYDQTMALGGYPNVTGTRGELYFSKAETKQAKWFRNKYAGKFFVVWSLNGSSHHKQYGLLRPVIETWLDQHSDVVVVLVGDDRAKQFEFEHPQVVCGSAKWDIRHSLALVPEADLVVGPESMMVNAAGCFDVPKITLLSHSTHENLCKYWTNDYCLEPNRELAPCYPCHQLHYSKESCVNANLVDENPGEGCGRIFASGPACAMGAIEADRMLARLDEVYFNHYKPIV